MAYLGNEYQLLGDYVLDPPGTPKCSYPIQQLWSLGSILCRQLLVGPVASVSPTYGI